MQAGQRRSAEGENGADCPSVGKGFPKNRYPRSSGKDDPTAYTYPAQRRKDSKPFKVCHFFPPTIPLTFRVWRFILGFHSLPAVSDYVSNSLEKQVLIKVPPLVMIQP